MIMLLGLMLHGATIMGDYGVRATSYEVRNRVMGLGFYELWG